MLALFEAYGLWGLLVLAFAESSFFPIPPDLLLIPLCLSSPAKALLYALLCTLASVTGGYLGYVLGKVIGQPLLYRFASGRTVEKVESMFTRYGAWAMFLAGLTPIPYKVFTISAGIFAMRVPSFMLASLLGRGLRFFTEAILIMTIGEQAVSFIGNNFEWLTMFMALLVICCYVMYKRGKFLGQLLDRWNAAVVAPLRQRFISIHENTYKTLGEWMAALGSGAFLTFFLADIIEDTLAQELHQSDVLVANILKPYLGQGWTLVSRLFNEWTLLLAIVLLIFLWFRQGAYRRIWFLFVSLLGSSLVLWSFSRLLVHSYLLSTGAAYTIGPLYYFIIDNLWASLAVVFFAGERPLMGGRIKSLLVGGVLLLFLATGRIAAGLRASEILISYATAALWAVVMWIIFLQKASREEKRI